MKLHEMFNVVTTKKTKLLGRGVGSGRGKTSTRGQKGAGARSGWKERTGTIGGAFPIYKMSPTRGFTRGRWAVRTAEVNIATIDRYFQAGEVVDLESLKAKGLINNRAVVLKVLGNGQTQKKLTIRAHAASQSSKEKLEKAGVTLELVGATVA